MKSGHAIEQDRPDILRQRRAWFDGQLDLEPERLVFIDESRSACPCFGGAWDRDAALAAVSGASACGWASRTASQDHHAGRRPADGRHGRPPMVLEGPINGDWFEAYVAQVLMPELDRGDVVVLDNPSNHKRASVRELIEAAGARLLFLPRYSPDFNPIEKAFSRLKAMLRKAAERTISGLWDLIGKLVDIFQPDECANYFSSCGYEPE